MKRALTILGSTGTIGVNALKLVEQYPDRFSVIALSAHSNVDLLAKQILQFKPLRVAVKGSDEQRALKERLDQSVNTEIYIDGQGLEQVAASPEADCVLSAIVGFAGIRPTMAAIRAGKAIALANKESLVAAGPLMLAAAKQHRVSIIPVDSEHSAIFQALQGNFSEIEKLRCLWLTASGGPFRTTPREEMAQITPEQALKHPTWNMGAKISIDSATMMNKGLEVIEATQLFGVSAKQVRIVVHPQSIIHSMIEYIDGSMLAQLGVTDMRGPLVYAMAYPQRLPEALPSLQLSQIQSLDFFEPDFEKFGCLKLAYAAAKSGGSMPAVLNAANEVCVEAFRQGRLQFLQIQETIADVMDAHAATTLQNLEQLYDIDLRAREKATALIKEKSCRVS